MIRIGIDTGGTYTDAAIVDTDGPQVLAKAKALTTRADLTRGIGAALDALPHELLAQAKHVALSTTLATNACVEGKGGRAKLIIVGTTDEVLHRVDAQETFGIPYDDVLTLPFVGTYDGRGVEIPDWDAIYHQSPAFFDEADSFGVASLYALNNGGVVERSAAEYLERTFGKPVVQAVDVASDPNVIERGATAMLNARLVPVIGDFLDAISVAFADRGLSVPVSIVRSDGSLMSEELARNRPVETILSGPAASVAGAQALAGEPESLIVDIGGTTSDLAIVHGNRANRTNGIAIGGWKTQVPGVFVDTIALGGDTVVRYTKASKLELGTRKATPLCIAASRWPQVKDSLRRYLDRSCVDFYARYELLYLMRDPGDMSRFADAERALIESLRAGPVSLFDGCADIVGLRLNRLEDEGIVMRCGMTPTDAMHLKGDFGDFDTEASRLGAQCLLKSYKDKDAAQDPDQIAALADEIYDLAEYRLFNQVVGAYCQDQFWPGKPSLLDDQMKTVMRRMWESRKDENRAPFSISAASEATFIGVGAPTGVFLGEVARVLQAPCAVPEHAGVANAVGAAASRVTVELQVRISPLRGPDGVVDCYHVHGAGVSQQFDSQDEAIEAARRSARELALAEARRRGAEEGMACSVDVKRSNYDTVGRRDILREWIATARVE